MRSALVLLALLPLAAAGQPPLWGESRYKEGNLVRALAPGPFTRPGLFGQDRLIQSNVEYAGEIRPVPAPVEEGIRAWHAARPGLESRPGRYLREFRFLEAGRELWIPVREGGDFTRHLARGDKLVLYVNFAGFLDKRPLAVAFLIARQGRNPIVDTVNSEAGVKVGMEAFEVGNAVQRIHGCLAEHRKRSPQGFPASLAEIGPAGSGCIDAASASGAVNRHRIAYWPGVRDQSGRAHLYSVCARPVREVLDGVTTFVADEMGAMAPLGQSIDDGPSLSCADATSDAFRRVKHCLVAHAGRGGYAADLSGFGAAGNGCLVSAIARSGARLVAPRIYHHSGDEDVRYEPQGEAPRSRFELRYERLYRRYVLEYLMTETASRHAALRRKGAVTRDSPSAEALQARLFAEDKADDARQQMLRPSCSAGTMADCYELAHRRFLWGGHDEARALWAKACSGGVAESCLFVEERLKAYSSAWDERCRKGEDLACRVLVSMRSRSVYSRALTFQRQCEDGDKAACRSLKEDAARFAEGGPIFDVPARVPRVLNSPGR